MSKQSEENSNPDASKATADVPPDPKAEALVDQAQRQRANPFIYDYVVWKYGSRSGETGSSSADVARYIRLPSSLRRLVIKLRALRAC